MRQEQLAIIHREVPINSVHTPDKDGFVKDSLLIINDRLLGQVALVRKKTQYVTGPADVLLIPLNQGITQITELTDAQGIRFASICSEVATAMAQITESGFPVIAVNQQPECVNLTSKFDADGTEIKVQTINQLHAHIFVEDGAGKPFKKIIELDKVSRKDFFDPVGQIAGPVITDIMNKSLGNLGFSTVQLLEETFPLGASVVVKHKLADLSTCSQLFSFLKSVQEDYFATYEQVKNLFLITDIAKRADSIINALGDKLTSGGIRKLSIIARQLKNYYEVPGYLRFVHGPALTWIIYQQADGVHINLTPRFLSRGNAMESLGVWIDQVDTDQEKSLACQHGFFSQLMLKLSYNNEIEKGEALKIYEAVEK